MLKITQAQVSGDDGGLPQENALAQDEAPEGNSTRLSIGELARECGVTLRALRFYQSKGLLAPRRDGTARSYSGNDRARLDLIQQGKRLGFTLGEIRDMVGVRATQCPKTLPMSRKTCIEQIKMLERQRRDADLALAELRLIYTAMFALPAP